MTNCNFVMYVNLIGELCAEVLYGCIFRCEILTEVHYCHIHQFYMKFLFCLGLRRSCDGIIILKSSKCLQSDSGHDVIKLGS
jgi:hypothetical protein